MKHANLDFNIGRVNPSGIGEVAYRIRKRYITSWPTVEDDPDKDDNIGEADMATLVGDFVLASGKKWQRIYSTQGKGSVTFETTGETDCKMFINHALLSFPDLTPEALGFGKASVNDDFVYLVKSAGRWHVIGSKDYRSVTTLGGPGSGTTAGSAKGCEFTVDCPDVTPIPVYVGAIVSDEGSLDAGTGVLTPSN